MSQKIKLDDTEYEVENLSDQANATLSHLKFVTARIKELENMRALLQRAKISYMDSLKKEILSNKSGFLIDDD